MNLQKIFRKNILELTPYASARSEFDGRASVFLDANENSYGSAAGGHYNRYPDPLQHALKERISMLKNVQPEQLFLGNGSDEAIDLLIRATCTPGIDNILLFPPTYGMYSVSAQINDVAIREVLLTPDFQLDIPAALAAIDAHTKLLFICSPNNPTGNILAQDSIEILLQNFSGLVVIDEAYMDFAPEQSWVSRLQGFPNLVILQTFSKAWGMAALRIGMAFASPEIIRILNAIKPPYNISAPAQELALEALNKQDITKRWTAEIITERIRLCEALQHFSFIQNIYPSDANFMLIKTENATRLYQYLLKKEIVVRNRTTMPLCHNCLRITVGTKAENETLIEAFHHYQP